MTTAYIIARVMSRVGPPERADTMADDTAYGTMLDLCSVLGEDNEESPEGTVGPPRRAWMRDAWQARPVALRMRNSSSVRVPWGMSSDLSPAL